MARLSPSVSADQTADGPEPSARPFVTVLVCTYNRRNDVCELIHSVLKQETGGDFSFELVVVDNNSDDGTSTAVRELIESRPGSARCFFEPRQGKSYALDTGLEAARGEVVFVVDSDQLLPPNYLMTVVRVFREHPEVSILGGKVLPLWPSSPPAWLTRSHWSAVAMCDYGDKAFDFDRARPLCLLAASFRRAHFDAVGGFRPGLAVSAGHIGGVEDADLSYRLTQAGYHGRYEPSLIIHHKAEPNRLTKAYHRRWHKGHGRFCALWRNPEIEGNGRRILGVPAYLAKAAVRDAFQWVLQTSFGRSSAFETETRLFFFLGFARQRLSDTRPFGVLSRRQSEA